MNDLKTFIYPIVVSVLLLFVTAFQSVVAENASKSDNVKFKWSFIIRTDPSGRNKIVNIAKETVTKKTKEFSVTGGDKISMYVEPGEGTYVYLFYHDSSEKLIPLFPTTLGTENFEDEFTPGSGTYIPAMHKWFTFDENKGVESFYLLASPDRLTKLEELTRNHIEERKELTKQKVLDEIRSLKKTNVFKTKQERLIPYSGRVRSGEIDIADLAVKTEAKTFYIRTIRIKHE